MHALIAFQELLVRRAKLLRRRNAVFQTHPFAGSGVERASETSLIIISLPLSLMVDYYRNRWFDCIEKMWMRGIGF